MLSTAIIGVVLVVVVNYLFFENIEMNSVVYLAFGYLTGYFINAISSLFEGLYIKMIKGRPSDKLLKLIEGQDWTGYKRVKFYEAETAIERLKHELDDEDASERKMFGCAKRKVV